MHIPGSPPQMGSISAQPLHTERHQRHDQQHPHTMHRGHMVCPGAMAMRHVDDLAGRADGRREPGRPHIQATNAVIEPAADDRQHLGIQDAGKNEPPVLPQALHHLGGEVQPQRQPDDPAPALVERCRAPAVRNSGPSSQGNGVPIQTARPAPTRAMQRPRMTGAMRVSMAKDDTRTQPPTYGSALPFLFPNGTGFAVHTGMWLELSCFS